MSEEDPFEKLDPPGDREGDPFEELGPVGPDADDGRDEPHAGEDGDDGTSGAGEASDVAATPEPDDTPAFEEAFVEGDTVGAGDGPAGLGEDDPFADLGDPGGDPFGEGEGVFEQVDVEALDADELWELLEDGAEGTPSAINHPVEVSKHRFCEQCEFFSGPPSAHCTNDEAEILEYIGMEQVRVIDCPVVAEQRRLENEE